MTDGRRGNACKRAILWCCDHYLYHMVSRDSGVKTLLWAAAAPFALFFFAVLAICAAILVWAYLFAHIFMEFRERWKHE